MYSAFLLTVTLHSLSFNIFDNSTVDLIDFELPCIQFLHILFYYKKVRKRQTVWMILWMPFDLNPNNDCRI